MPRPAPTTTHPPRGSARLKRLGLGLGCALLFAACAPAAPAPGDPAAPRREVTARGGASTPDGPHSEPTLFRVTLGELPFGIEVLNDSERERELLVLSDGGDGGGICASGGVVIATYVGVFDAAGLRGEAMSSGEEPCAAVRVPIGPSESLYVDLLPADQDFIGAEALLAIDFD